MENKPTTVSSPSLMLSMPGMAEDMLAEDGYAFAYVHENAEGGRGYITLLNVPIADYIKENGVSGAVAATITREQCAPDTDRITLDMDALTDGTGLRWNETARVPILNAFITLDPRGRYYVAHDCGRPDEALLMQPDPERGGEPFLLTIWAPDAGRYVTLMDLYEGLAALEATVVYAKQMLDEWKDYEEHKNAETDALTVRWGPIVSQITRAATRRKKPTTITLKNSRGEIAAKVTAVEDYLELKPSGRKTFTLLDREATRMSMAGEYRHDGETVCRVALDVREVAELYGITEESAKKRLRADFKAIANQKLTFEKKGKGGGWVTIPVAGGAFGIRKGNAIFTFSPDIMQLVLNPTAPQVDLPPELYATDDANFRSAFQIGAKLYAHDNQNHGKPNQDHMRLETLLNAAREIPTAEELANNDRSMTERIMGPFEAAMDHLVSVGALKDWDYCHEKGRPLTDEEYRAIETERELGRPTPWGLARGLLVTWELGRRYPAHEAARQESRGRRRAEAEAARALKEKEAKAREKRIRGKVETMEAKARAEAERAETEAASGQK